MGVYLERLAPLPTQMLLGLLIGLAAAWLLAIRQQRASSTLLLWCLAALLAATWHRVTLAWPADAIGHFATADRLLVRVRGCVAEDVTVHQPRRPELRSVVSSSRSTFLLDTRQLHLDQAWQPVSGRVRVTVDGDVKSLTIGDGVEILGSLWALAPPANPGDENYRQILIDHHVQASLAVKSAEAILPHPDSEAWSIAAAMARARAWVRATLQTWLPTDQAGIAQALLCGDQTSMLPDQLDAYLQTSVYHVLAVSGQHLLILCAFVGLVLRFTGWSMRSRALWLAVFVLLYMFLTGARPPVVRAAVIVLAWVGTLWLRRPPHPLNALALAWIVVASLHPADLASTGCQLSFLAVLILTRVTATAYHQDLQAVSPLDRLEARFRPLAFRLVYWLLRLLKWAYLATFLVWMLTLPLILERYHLVSPVAILIAPLLAITISGALVTGVVLVVFSWMPWLATPLGWFMNLCLSSSDAIVNAGRDLPYSFGYWPDPPNWWVHVFYFALVAFLIQRHWWTWRKFALGAIAAWFALGLWLIQPDVPDHLRVTVLAVGHGTAVVMETPDGRCLLYDAGSLAGPEIAQRVVSSYLWHRGRTRLDEVFISHADLDHFNALIDLSDRFRIGQVRLTPSFSQRPDPGTQATLRHLATKGISVTSIKAGDQFHAGDLSFHVLHPPRDGPPGPENARSLVMLLTYHDYSLLLTGDLEQAGMDMVLRQPRDPVDILVAPHHGSRVSNTDRFADWCQPQLVLSSETYPRTSKPDPYSPRGATLWRTWIHGGVTINITPDGIQAETYLTRLRWTGP
jgi:competence protein ComEC